MKRLFLANEGTCVRVELVGIEVKNAFLASGWREVFDQRDADLVIVNTCSFLKSREDFFMERIERIVADRTLVQDIMVIGCLPSSSEAELKRLYPKILLFGRDVEPIKAYFGLEAPVEVRPARVSERLTPGRSLLHLANRYLIKSPHIDYRLKRDKVAYLQISTGCQGICTYCSERFTTKHASKPVADILKAIDVGVSDGYELFGLSSDDASAYGRDIGASLDDLLEAIIAIDAPIRFNLPECNPNGLTPRVMRALEDPKFLYVTIPIQSGSQIILDAMARPYQIDEVTTKLEKLRKNNPRLLVNTHIIVGFPGETDSDFRKTLDLLETGLFDRVKVFSYSPRPNTPAALFPDQIDEETKVSRRMELLRVMRRVNLRQRSLVNLILNKEQLK